MSLLIWLQFLAMITLCKIIQETCTSYAVLCAGPHIKRQPVRTDTKDAKKCLPDGRLPDGGKGSVHLRNTFNRMGFNDREIVALSGAHALGRVHLTLCTLHFNQSRACCRAPAQVKEKLTYMPSKQI